MDIPSDRNIDATHLFVQFLSIHAKTLREIWPRNYDVRCTELVKNIRYILQGGFSSIHSIQTAN